jgi:streptogramin lyase
MSADTQGNVWFGEFGNVGKLAMADTRTNKITEYPTPTKHSGAYSVDVDAKTGMIWFNEMMADQIARFNPRTRTMAEFPMLGHLLSTRRIELDHSRTNRVWYTGFYVDTVAYLDVVE